MTVRRSRVTFAGELQRIAAHEPSLILAHLTDAEIDAFQRARVPYTGATDHRAGGTHEPYIAIAGRDAALAFAALGWSSVSLHISGRQWIARRGRRAHA